MTAALSLPRTANELRILGQYARGRATATIAEALDLSEADVDEVIQEFAGGDPQRAAEAVAAYNQRASAVSVAHGTPTPAPKKTIKAAAAAAPAAPVEGAGALPGKPYSSGRVDAIGDRLAGEVAAVTAEVARLVDEAPPAVGDAGGHDTAEAQPEPAPAPEPVDAVRPPRGLEDLLTWAETHGQSRTVTLAARARTILGELRQRVDAEQADLREREATAALRTELANKEAELLVQLAGVRTQLKELRRPGGTAETLPQPATPVASSRAVRAWAAQAGVECNTHGRVPTHVVAAYLAATGGGEQR